ncbi:MAG TPA: hypothetical protein VGE67_01605 [Haloferula sp.]
MLALDSSRWSELSCRSVSGSEFAEMLAELYTGPISDGELLREVLVECNCEEFHEVAFAAAPHLIALSKNCGPDFAIPMLSVAAHAFAEASGQAVPPPDLRDAALFEQFNRDDAEIARHLLDTIDPDHPYHLELEACLAAFSGNFDEFLAIMTEVESRQDAEAEAILERHNNQDRPSNKLRVDLDMGEPQSFTWNGPL